MANVTGPEYVYDEQFGQQLKELCVRIEDFLTSKPIIHEGDNSRHLSFTLKNDEYIDDVIRARLKEKYESAGWKNVSFNYSGFVYFYFPKIG